MEMNIHLIPYKFRNLETQSFNPEEYAFLGVVPVFPKVCSTGVREAHKPAHSTQWPRGNNFPSGDGTLVNKNLGQDFTWHW